MIIIDRFKHIEGRDVFIELCDLIKEYRMRFEVKKEDNEHSKTFYLPYFDNKDYFIKFEYAPYKGTFVPYRMTVYQNCGVTLGDDGLTIDTTNPTRIFYIGDKKITIHDWKKVKKNLIESIDFAIDKVDKVAEHYYEWTDGEVNPRLMYFESLRVKQKENS